MKTKDSEALESYFKTENEHWNGYAFKILCEVLQQGQFENPEIPLQLFDFANGSLCEFHKTPMKAVQVFEAEISKFKLNPSQTLFIYECVCKFLENTDFGEQDLTPVYKLMQSQLKKLKTEAGALIPLTKNIRETLKELMQKELEQLPETMKELEPVQRLNILCKLMPFILPKVESVTHDLNEPDKTGLKW